jgi:hypothetical protein
MISTSKCFNNFFLHKQIILFKKLIKIKMKKRRDRFKMILINKVKNILSTILHRIHCILYIKIVKCLTNLTKEKEIGLNLMDLITKHAKYLKMKMTTKIIIVFIKKV